jgi:hypothetical protein
MKTARTKHRTCTWTWRSLEERWMTDCGYAFSRQAYPDYAGTFMPFPFCPYCGKSIRKAVRSTEGGAA